MREIKFRIWSFDLQKMSYPYPGADYLIRISGEIELQIDVGENSNLFFPPPKAVLMQYTGFKDKNGKEIYEGDITRFGTSKGEVIALVEYQPPMYIHRPIKGGLKTNAYILGAAIISGEEVIGNIYENPELLEAIHA